MANLALQRFNQTIQNENFQKYLDIVLKENKKDFVTSLVSLVGNNAMLQQCDPMTVTYAALKAAALNLSFDPNLGFAYCIPYKDNKNNKTDAQFQIGAKGLAQLAIRTGQFKYLNTTEIYDGQYKGKDIRTGRVKLDETIEVAPDAKVVGYLGYFQLLNGYEFELYWTKEKMQQHAQRFSKSVNYGPWKSDFDAMARKTILKQLLKQGNAPMSIEMQMAMNADQAIIHGDEYGNETLEYRDNPMSAQPSHCDFDEEESTPIANEEQVSNELNFE